MAQINVTNIKITKQNRTGTTTGGDPGGPPGGSQSLALLTGEHPGPVTEQLAFGKGTGAGIPHVLNNWTFHFFLKWDGPLFPESRRPQGQGVNET